MTVYSSDLFSYHAPTKVFSTEASTAQFAPAHPFLMRSERTGRLAEFHMSSVDRDAEGDVLAWLLRPSTRTITENPKLAGVLVSIFNT